MKKKIAILLVTCMIFSNIQTVTIYAEDTVQQEKQEENQTIEEVEENREDKQDDSTDWTEKNKESDKDVETQESTSKVQEREVININEGWNFTSNDNTTEGWSFPKGGESGVIDLPHCWEYVHPTQSYIPQKNMKTVTYTKEVDISEMKNRNMFLKFYGSARNTEVLIDGENVGTHIGGYSAFTFDISDYVKDKDKIKITANVTNLDTTSIPINVDYTQWAGIYRDVELIATDEQYFSTEDYGNKGIYIKPIVNGNSANIEMKAEISNKADEKKSLKMITEILDAEGNNIVGDEQEIEVEAKSSVQPFISNYTINEVHLWNGVKDPYLYTMNVKLCDETGNKLDEISEKFGVRTYEIKDGKWSYVKI